MICYLLMGAERSGGLSLPTDIGPIMHGAGEL